MLDFRIFGFGVLGLSGLRVWGFMIVLRGFCRIFRNLGPKASRLPRGHGSFLHV